MTYLPNRNRPHPGALSGISDVATAVRDVVEDPCLFQVAGIVSHLNDLQQKTPSTGAAAPRTPGIGLCSAVRPLQAVTYIAERPWIVPVGIAAIFGTMFALGYMFGRGR